METLEGPVLLCPPSMRSLQSASDSWDQCEHVFVTGWLKWHSSGGSLKMQESADTKQQSH